MRKKHRTHLPERFLLDSPEENLIAAIIKQAWCDAFMKIGSGYIGIHNSKEREIARRMFEEEAGSEWRQSLTTLAELIDINDTDIVRGYYWYKKMAETKTAACSPEKAFDAMLKVIIRRR